MRRELDLQDARDRETAPLTIDFEIDRDKFGIELITHRCGKDRKSSGTRCASVCDLGDRLTLWFRSAVRDVKTHGAIALVYRPRPGSRIDEVQTSQRHIAKVAFPNVVANQGFAAAAGGNPAEVAGATEVAIAAFHVVALDGPLRCTHGSPPPNRFLLPKV